MTWPRSCRAALLTDYGAPFAIDEVAVPQEIEPGAVLVKTLAATVCATDVHYWEGKLGSRGRTRLPVIIGHEMVGRVIDAAGARTDSVGQPLAPGDRIIWTHGYCGHCPECTIERRPVLCENMRPYMFASPRDYPFLNGGFAEYGYVYPTSGRIRVPDSVSDEVASAASCALRTMVNAFDQLGRIEERQTVVVQGSGPLGLFATALASTMGPRRIVVVGGPERRLALARQWGAEVTLDVAHVPVEQRRERIRDLTDGRGADIVIEVSGAVQAFAEGVAMLRRGGRYLVVGQVHRDTLAFNPSILVNKQARVIGSFSGSTGHYARALTFLATHAGRFRWDDIISNRYPLDEIDRAFDGMRRHEEVKPAIVMGDLPG